MIERTKEEIEEFAKKLWEPDMPYLYRPELKVTPIIVNYPDTEGWEISIKQMYTFVPLNFEILLKLAKFFDTLGINDERYSQGGCESCDYGSSYEVRLTISPTEEKPK